MSLRSKMQKWERLASEVIYACRIFSLRKDYNRAPQSGQVHEFFVLETPDWVNIIPLTSDGKVVMVHQYRHGTGEVTLEIPGGMVDPEDPSPLHAARREMREETGYDSEDIVPLGSVHPNPAIQNNRCHTFLARNVLPCAKPQLDSTEETEVVLVPLEKVPSLVRQGAISHALVVVAFYWQDLFSRYPAS